MLKILESPMFKNTRPWWLPFVMLLLTLHGILFLHWDLKPVIFLFWWEVILMIGAALVRMLFAMDNRPFLDHVFLKIQLLIGGVIMGWIFVMFSVVFTFQAFSHGDEYSALANIPLQTKIMTMTYILSLAVHYFGNNNYKTANPGSELMRPFIQLLVLLAFLQALTMHLIPRYPQLNQAVWVAVALVLLKFVVDALFAQIGKQMKDVF